jgi:hypothetical protein
MTMLFGLTKVFSSVRELLRPKELPSSPMRRRARRLERVMKLDASSDIGRLHAKGVRRSVRAA